MVNITGSVERITYYNQENGYTVLRLRPETKRGERIPGLNLEGLLTVVGNLPELSPGEHVRLHGDYSTHPKHGLQFQATICEKISPVTLSGIERYLGSGLIKGIGPQLAKRIVKHFKSKTLEIIEKDPQKLREVPGIGPDRTSKIITAWEEQQKIKEIMLFLHGHQVSTNLAVKIYKTYGDGSLDVVRSNPYQLEQDINGIGFKTADRIAQNLGLSREHPSRIEAGIIYAINETIDEGHVYATEDQLINRAGELLAVDLALIRSGLSRLEVNDRIKMDIVSSRSELSNGQELKISESTPHYGDPIVYLSPFFFSEKGVAQWLIDRLKEKFSPKQRTLGFETLSKEQEQAIDMALCNPVSIITGGPGTGKTTCLKALIRQLEANNIRYALASPTGRAAKRLAEATGRSASTIHRLLAYKPGSGFQNNEKYPLNIDFLVVDEASMLDLLLTYHLLKALKAGTQVLFVGDVDQLPSVGAGDILRDLIACSQMPVARLKKIYRQAKGSQIITNAHRINQGWMPRFSESLTGDFFMFPADDAQIAADWVVDLVSSRIPAKFNLDPIKEIQVLSPMYRGEAGVDALNERLQAELNPPHHKKVEQKLFGRIFRIGDKVMQIRNNYDKEIYNGDIGMIASIDRIEQSISVVMDGAREVKYDFSEADELVLAYAVSVHKSQGSEFPAVVIPVITQHYVMLQRNLIYTAVTRAEKLCVLIGNQQALRIAIRNNKISKRNSRLSERINEKS
jgi:exodeoxyribonuclease V alpha subunit